MSAAPDKVLDRLLQALSVRVPDILAVYRFGSYGTAAMRADSDIDLGLLAERPLDPVHITRTRGLGLPQDAREAFTLLEQAGAIPVDVANRMRAMVVGFRNVAVHQYQALSLPILRAILSERLVDFRAFTGALIS